VHVVSEEKLQGQDQIDHHGQSNAYQPTDSMSRLASRHRLAIVLKTFTVTCRP
jgi:hypothetical protein